MWQLNFLIDLIPHPIFIGTVSQGMRKVRSPLNDASCKGSRNMFFSQHAFHFDLTEICPE